MREEDWKQSGPGEWTAVLNKQVKLWIEHWDGASVQDAKDALAADGFTGEGCERACDLRKQEGDTISRARLFGSAFGAWGVCYSYPLEAEEGWGMELPALAETFAVSEPDQKDENGAESANADAGDVEKIRAIVENFADAYFNGDTEAVQGFLTDSFLQEPAVYEGTGTVRDFELKGLSEDAVKEHEDGTYEVNPQLQFRDSARSADSYQYLDFVFVKQDGEWKIQSYGLDG